MRGTTRREVLMASAATGATSRPVVEFTQLSHHNIHMTMRSNTMQVASVINRNFFNGRLPGRTACHASEDGAVAGTTVGSRRSKSGRAACRPEGCGATGQTACGQKKKLGRTEHRPGERQPHRITLMCSLWQRHVVLVRLPAKARWTKPPAPSPRSADKPFCC